MLKTAQTLNNVLQHIYIAVHRPCTNRYWISGIQSEQAKGTNQPGANKPEGERARRRNGKWARGRIVQGEGRISQGTKWQRGEKARPSTCNV